jgi:uncharacterized protein (DUF39 family)
MHTFCAFDELSFSKLSQVLPTVKAPENSSVSIGRTVSTPSSYRGKEDGGVVGSGGRSSPESISPVPRPMSPMSTEEARGMLREFSDRYLGAALLKSNDAIS